MMHPAKNSTEHYGWVAMLLHWGMAVLIIGLLALGLYMSDLPLSPDKLKLYGWHKSFGATVLGLVIFRFLWRSRSVIPPMPDAMSAWQKLAAHGAHYALYGFMVAMPVSGWLMSSAAGFPVSVFGLFTLPNLVAPDQELRKLFGEAHELLAYALMATIAAHAAAALLHHFVHKDNVLRRMLP